METVPLIITDSKKSRAASRGLSVGFATLCIIDLFGVFPIIALPRPIIDCEDDLTIMNNMGERYLLGLALPSFVPSIDAALQVPCLFPKNWPFSTGWIGLPLAGGVFAMQIYTALLLGRSWVLAEKLDPTIVEKSRYPYAALANLTMGSRISKLVTFLLDVTIFGSGIPNLLVASQNMQLLGAKVTNNSFHFSFCYWMLFFGLALCPIMWLGSPKDMKWLAVASVSTVCCVGSLTWICMLTDDSLPDGFRPRTTAPSWEAIAIAYGILAFQFDIHPMILTVQVDMEKKNDLGKAILGAFFLTGSLFAVTTSIGYWKYGSAGIRYNLLQGLPASGPLYTDVLLVTMQIALSMVVGASALFQDIEEKLGVPQEFSWRRCLLRSSVLFLAVLVGESVPRFDLVMGLVGGSLTGPLMFILPPLFYRRLRERTFQKQVSRRLELDCGEFVPRLRRQWVDVLSFDVLADSDPPSFWDSILTTTIVVLGVTATIATTYFSVRDTLRYATFTPPCLVNVTLASKLMFSIDLSNN